MRHSIPDCSKRQLTRLYNKAISASASLCGSEIKEYESYILPSIEIENGVIEKNDECVTAWVGLEMLFTESVNLWKGDITKVHSTMAFMDKNIASNNAIVALFDYFAGADKDNRYFEITNIVRTEEEKEKELYQREALFRVYLKEYDKGLNFFVDSAPLVVWNPKGYFNLYGGHHRTMFLLHKKHNYFPVKIEAEAFDRWCNITIFKKLKKYIYENKVDVLYAPIPHPGFMSFPSEYEFGPETRIKSVFNFFSEIDVKNMSVLDCSNDEGYFARNMDRIGARSSCFVNCDQIQLQLAGLINELLYRENVIIENKSLDELDLLTQYEIVIAVNINCVEEQIEKLIRLSKCYLILEAEDINLIKKVKTAFSDCRQIYREYYKGKCLETWIFIR